MKRDDLWKMTEPVGSCTDRVRILNEALECFFPPGKVLSYFGIEFHCVEIEHTEAVCNYKNSHGDIKRKRFTMNELDVIHAGAVKKRLAKKVKEQVSHESRSEKM